MMNMFFSGLNFWRSQAEASGCATGCRLCHVLRQPERQQGQRSRSAA